jgi:hypothetical protein
MRLKPDDELLALFHSVLAEGRTPEEWRERESDDEFQSPHYVGGYDADEDAFCFSRYDEGEEWWFQVTLEEVRSFAAGEEPTLELRRPS